MFDVPFPSAPFRSRLEALCASYSRFLEANEQDRELGEIVVLYGSHSVEERNITHEVATYLPDFVGIGNDSGDEEFLLNRDGSETVFGHDPGCFGVSEPRVVHPCFSQWLAAECPLPAEAREVIPLAGQIWLLAAPPGGMKDMLALKKFLGASWSIPQMQNLLAATPVLLIEDGHPFGMHRKLGEHETFRPLLGFTEPGIEEMQRFSDFEAG